MYLMYGDVTSYKDAIWYAIATTAGFTDIIQLGYFNMGVAWGWSTAKDTICLISVTAKFKDDSKGIINIECNLNMRKWRRDFGMVMENILGQMEDYIKKISQMKSNIKKVLV